MGASPQDKQEPGHDRLLVEWVFDPYREPGGLVLLPRFPVLTKTASECSLWSAGPGLELVV